MKITVTKEVLLKGLQRIKNVVSNRTTPILSNVLIEATEKGVRLTTTDLELGIRCDIEAKVDKTGATTLPAKRLVDVVSGLPVADITIEVDSKNMATLRCATAQYKIFGLSKDEFPPFPAFAEAKTYNLQQGVLLDGLRKTSYAISPDETRYVLNGIYFSFADNKFTLAATDGRRLALFDADLEFSKKLEKNFIVPTKAVRELLHIVGEEGEIEIAASENLALFRMAGVELATKLVEGAYPDYKRVIPGEAKERVTIDREQFLSVAKRVSLFSPEKSGSLRLTLDNGEMSIFASTPEAGEAEESIAVKYSGRKMVIAFNPEFLMDPLKNLSEGEVYLDLIDEMSPGAIKIDSPFLYVIMPMRVSL